jgi:hypothetical protein
VLEAECEAPLERSVRAGERGLGSQPVAKVELVAEASGVGRHEVQMVGSPARMRLAEPVHLVRPVRRVEVAEPRQRPEAGSRGAQIVDADEDVDDRLGVEPGDGRAADVVDAARGPVPDRPLERVALLLEAPRPLRVVGLDTHRFVRPLPHVRVGPHAADDFE